MTEKAQKVGLKLLRTGVPGLDDVLGGGLPEFSFNLIAGTPGSGKTTLMHQLVFANASVERPALYFTVVGEPALKMLRYQQQMAFFDTSKFGDCIRFIDLSEVVLQGDLEQVLETILHHMREANPAIVVVDSFRTVVRSGVSKDHNEGEIQAFLQRLGLHLASWQATSFVVGEYSAAEMHGNPVFTIADGIIWLSQEKERNSMVRKLEVTKMRGAAALTGLHIFRITSRGLQVFPRTIWPLSPKPAHNQPPAKTRTSTGVAELDTILGGGLPSGDLTLVAGPSGTGKTVISTHFIAAGVEAGEPGVLAIFEEEPDEYIARAESMGLPLGEMSRQGKVKVMRLQPLDLTVGEILHQITSAVDELGATRLVIDSLNGLELTLSPNHRSDFRESLYRMVGALRGIGVSVLMTVEVTEAFDSIAFSPHAVSFLSQNIIFLRYVELAGRLQKVLAVIKTRRSHHLPDFHAYEITSKGLRLKHPMSAYEGILKGSARPARGGRYASMPGLSAGEQAVVDRLFGHEEATAAQLAGETGMPEAELVSVLGRLVDLNYVFRVQADEEPVYRLAVRPLGANKPGSEG